MLQDDDDDKKRDIDIEERTIPRADDERLLRCVKRTAGIFRTRMFQIERGGDDEGGNKDDVVLDALIEESTILSIGPRIL